MLLKNKNILNMRSIYIYIAVLFFSFSFSQKKELRQIKRLIDEKFFQEAESVLNSNKDLLLSHYDCNFSLNRSYLNLLYSISDCLLCLFSLYLHRKTDRLYEEENLKRIASYHCLSVTSELHAEQTHQ